MDRTLVPLLLLVIASVMPEATAAGILIDTPVYRVTDEQGNITFADQPKVNSGIAERQPLPIVNLMQAPVASKPDHNVASSLAISSGSTAPASSIQPCAQDIMVSPIECYTLRNTTGALTVKLSLIPQLQMGHQVQLWVDGQRHGSAIKATTLHVTNIERGAHQFICLAVHADGRPVTSTAAVLVHVKRPFNRRSR